MSGGHVWRTEFSRIPLRPSRALFDRHVLASGRAGVDLPRTADPLRRRMVHLHPVGDPARQPAHREQHREHLHGNSQSPINDARVEIDVRVELALDEIRIGQRRRFQFLGDIEDRIVDVPLLEQLIAGGLDDRRPRVVVLVDAMAKAHQPRSRCPCSWPARRIS